MEGGDRSQARALQSLLSAVSLSLCFVAPGLNIIIVICLPLSIILIIILFKLISIMLLTLRPVHLLRVFLLRVLESNFPGDSL